eukprot:CAMPEP_0198291440 /NCGR_PEP_ID=MMETSP1449-20131203/8961_1 /TAXON_ID=420275 /ORGANISM="Attheya septentrionalis, Strain CCMP2084" /LENGTH=1144 /DNA_ID=CAMNT_0043990077 /DNA_START=34 /DNA_END=3468 /DNA_ORIENTATION=+
MASADGAKSVNDFIRRIALSSYKHSSSSTLAKGEAIVVDESARRALGDESVMEAVRNCSGDKAFKRVLNLFVSGLMEEAKVATIQDRDGWVTDTSAQLSEAICHVIVEHRRRAEDTRLDLTHHAGKYMEKVLQAAEESDGGNSKYNRCKIISESMMAAARRPLSDTIRGEYGPALILAEKAHAVAPSPVDKIRHANSSKETDEVAFRRDQMDLLGRRLFALGSNFTPATEQEVSLSAPLITELTKEEFDGAMLRPLKFKLTVDRASTMETLNAFFRILDKAGKGKFIEKHLLGSTNLVGNAVQAIPQDADNSVGVLKALVRASPATGTKAVSEALSQALKNSSLPPQTKSSLVNAFKEIALTLSSLRESGKSVDDSGWKSIAENIALSSIEDSGADGQLIYSASQAWTELTGASSLPKSKLDQASSLPKSKLDQAERDVLAKNRARRGSSKAATRPGAEPMSTSEATRMDRRIQAKQGTAAPNVARNDDRSNTERVNSSGSGRRQSRSQESLARTEQDIISKNRERRSTPAVEPSVDHSGEGRNISRLDNRINNKIRSEGGSEKQPTMNSKVEGDQLEPDSTLRSPFIETSHGVGNDGGMEYGLLSTERGMGDSGGLAVAIAVEEEDNTFIPAAIQYDPDSKPPIFKNRRFRLYGLAGILLLVIIVVGVSIAISKNVSGKSKRSQQVSVGASGEPTFPPTMAPTTGREGEGLLGEFAKISSTEQLSDPNSAQYKAAQWIQFDDPQNLALDAVNLLQRYALVVAYFSLQENGPWVVCGIEDNSHTDPSLCTGRKRVYTGDVDDPNDQNIYENIDDENKWLSAESECWWFGVYCGDDMTVVIIEIVDNNLVGQLPEELAALTFLEDFRVYWNGISGTIPHWLANYRQLSDIELHYNKFTGEIPDGLYEREDFERINVGGNMLTGTISTKIGKLAKLKGLFVMENMMTGTIPTEIGNLSLLAFTRWFDNRFDTTLPTEVGQLQKVREFWMFNMGVRGTIPTEIGKMTDLDVTRLEANLLEGTIPDELFNARKMSTLYLHNNNLVGTLSTNVEQMVDLQQLTVKFNSLTGAIPTEFESLEKLWRLWIYKNDFEGAVPPGICNLQYLKLTDLIADCAKTNLINPPKNQCDCCRKCCDSANGGVCSDVDS